MTQWLMCTVKYAKENEQGLLKNVSEKYLIDAESFTEAEARIYELLGSVIRGDFQVTGIAKTNINDVFFYEDTDIWHQCKIAYTVVDADSGREKKVTHYMLVSAHDVKEAYDRVHESLSNMQVSFQVPEIKETNIVEVFPYEKEEPEEEEAPTGGIELTMPYPNPPRYYKGEEEGDE